MPPPKSRRNPHSASHTRPLDLHSMGPRNRDRAQNMCAASLLLLLEGGSPVIVGCGLVLWSSFFAKARPGPRRYRVGRSSYRFCHGADKRNAARALSLLDSSKILVYFLGRTMTPNKLSLKNIYHLQAETVNTAASTHSGRVCFGIETIQSQPTACVFGYGWHTSACLGGFSSRGLEELTPGTRVHLQQNTQSSKRGARAPGAGGGGSVAGASCRKRRSKSRRSATVADAVAGPRCVWPDSKHHFFGD